MTTEIQRLLELKKQAWNAMPDYGPGDLAADPAWVRFRTICDVCEIFGVNDLPL
jgi:hypothetical protein